MNHFQNLKRLVFKDVASENESSRISIILRMNSLIMCSYFLVLLFSFFFLPDMYLLGISIPCFIAYCFCFYLTYLNRTRAAVWVTFGVTIVFILCFVHVFGMKCNAQQFVFVLLVLSFMVSFSSKWVKIARGALLCLFRIGLYVYSCFYEPISKIGDGYVCLFAILNCIVIFALIISSVSVFTEDSLELERKLVVYNDKLRHLAGEDPLTGLANRRSVMNYVEKVTDPELGNPDKVSIAIADIDWYKKINDRYGHGCGDILLRQLANQFELFMAGKGMVGRWGGEEFLFVFYDMTSEDAYYYLTQLQNQIRTREFVYKDENIHITMTYGLVEYNLEKGIDSVISEADKKLYMGKESGRNTIIY